MALKSQHYKLRNLQFHYIKWLKKGIPTLKCWHFEVSEDIITKFKSQGLYIIRIKYWNASGSGSRSPPSLIPALWNIGYPPQTFLGECKRILVFKNASKLRYLKVFILYYMTLTIHNVAKFWVLIWKKDYKLF